MESIFKHFPNLTEKQRKQFSQLPDLYREWNEKINVVSRKDAENLEVRHVLHSLAISKLFTFKPGTKILDVGTGGGFPGIPLAIMNPDCEFHLIDSIGKKISVVQGVADAVGLTNVKAEHIRVQQIKDKYDFVVSRAVTAFPKFVAMSRKVVAVKQKNAFPNGIIYLKGGDFAEEIKPFKESISVFEITDWFEDEFFETKKVIHLPV